MSSCRKPVRPDPWADPDRLPNMRTVAQWLGSAQHRRWEELVQFIGDRYHGLFTAKWRYTQVRRNWELQFQHGRTFCALLPSRERFFLRLTVTPQEELQLGELRLGSFMPSPDDRSIVTPTGGRVVMFEVVDDDSVITAQQLLAVKRSHRYLAS